MTTSAATVAGVPNLSGGLLRLFHAAGTRRPGDVLGFEGPGVTFDGIRAGARVFVSGV